MVNSLNKEDIDGIITQSLNGFFEKFEAFIGKAPKMVDENSLKQ
jgi:hypothetical protein